VNNNGVHKFPERNFVGRFAVYRYRSGITTVVVVTCIQTSIVALNVLKCAYYGSMMSVLVATDLYKYSSRCRTSYSCQWYFM